MPGLSISWCRTPDIGLPAPDLTIFLDITPEKAKERGGYGAERYEKEEMQKSVRQIFAGFAEEAKERLGPEWVTIDAGQSIDIVGESIRKEVDVYLKQPRTQQLRRLWTTFA